MSEVPSGRGAQLPPEIVLQVFAHLEHDRDLAKTRLVSHAFDELVRSPVLWLDRIKGRWRRGRKLTRTSDPYDFYVFRCKRDNAVISTIRELSVAVRSAIPAVERLRGYGDDIIDVLEKEKAVRESDDPELWLCRRYWATKCWDAILRDSALRTWTGIVEGWNGGIEANDAFEEGLMAFSAFHGVDRVNLQDRYERAMPGVITACSGALAKQDREERLTLISAAVNRTMRDMGIKPASSDDYHDVTNHFLHDVWNRTDAPDQSRTMGTLPMTLVSIFCSFVNRLPANFDVQAKPIGFPGTVLAAIAARSEAKDKENWIRVNVFQNGKIMKEDELRSIRVAIEGESLLQFMLPASAKEMCTRVARNILHSIRTRDIAPQIMSTALYSTAHALFIFSGTSGNFTFGNWIASLCQSEYPLDVYHAETIARQAFSDHPSRREEILSLCTSIRDEDGEVPKRKERPDVVTRRVGKVFPHRLFTYTALVRGWDDTCEASEQWITAMQVDRLPYGRHQPFYHVIAHEGSRRYVAQENIVDDPVSEEAFQLILSDISVGEFFRKVENRDGERWFVKNARMEIEYPED